MFLSDLNIKKFRLKEIMGEFDIIEQELEYAGFEGVAELLGWKINFFRRKSNLDNTVAIWFFDIVEKETQIVANEILKRLKIDLQFGECVKDLGKLGRPDMTDELLEDTIRYGYIVKPDFFVSLGLTDTRLTYLEIVNDEDIISEIQSIRSGMRRKK